MRTKLPIGIDDFSKVIEGDYVYIDKTMLIDELLNLGTEVTLFTRPRRFGKTLNMSMLRYFFDIRERSRSENLFRGLAIERSPHYALRGKNPVIFLTLKDLKSTHWSGVLSMLGFKIAEFCKQHTEITDALKDADASFFRDALNDKLNSNSLGKSLLNLCAIFNNYYKERVVLLIDEYDAPLLSAYEYGYYDEAIAFFRVFLGAALKSNPYLDFAALTGVLRVSKESLFSGLNNVRVYSVLSEHFCDKFGFTQAEVETLVESQKKRLQGRDFFTIEAMRQWYDGYFFGSQYVNAEVYNPWSVLMSIDNGSLGPYWVNTGSDKLIDEILIKNHTKALPLLEKLINGESISVQLSDHTVLQSMHANATLDELWSLLFFAGYLTLATPPNSYGDCNVRMPNREICHTYRLSVRKMVQFSGEYLELLTNLHGNRPAFERMLKEMLRGAPSYFDILGENSVHMFVLGVFVALGSERFRATSNREYGDGRPDILVEDDEREHGYVLEFKKAKDGEDLQEAASRALAQIEEKRYAAILEDKQYRHITKLGVGFWGKEVELVWG